MFYVVESTRAKKKRASYLCMAWFNVFVQVFYPLAVAFSPIVIGAPAAFVHDLEQVRQYPPVQLPELGNDLSDFTSFDAEAFEESIATIAIGASQLFSNSNVGDQAKSRVISAGESAVNSAINSWVGQFGTAAVSLNSTGKGTFDFLLSVLEGKDYLFYTQLGARSDEERTFFNAGVGARFFQPEAMFGVNSFYDYDLTGNNRRLGVGAELWRDYLKLAANSYLRLNDWQQSSLSSMVDYDERPANGFDLRLKGYLPSYPQLGANVAFEQYYGNEVALADANDRSPNPSAFSYGLEYTPFSLLTFGVAQKHSGSIHDTSITMDLNLRLGVPLSRQLDGASVAQSRTLMGSRYDLVERNNTIVMDYRKQILVTVELQAHGNPVAGGVMTVTPTVVAKYGLDRVNWDAATLEMDGGTLESQSDGSLRVTLPMVSAGVLPAYTIGAVAVDKKGNRSERATLVIQMLDGGEVARPAITMLAVSKPTALADGADEIGITVVAANGLVPLAGEVVQLTFDAQSGTARSNKPQQTLTTGEDGVATTVLTSTRAVEAEVTATLIAHDVKATERFAFVADEGTAQHEELAVVHDNAVADGESENRVQAVVTDANGNPVSGVEVVFAAGNDAQILSPVLTDKNGVAMTGLTNTRAGKSEVTATLNGLSSSVVTTFVADAASAAIVSEETDFTVESGAIANGVATNAVSAKVTDAKGNPVADVEVTFAVTSGSATLGQDKVKTGADGVASSTLTSTVAGDNKVTAAVGTQTTEPKTSRFVADTASAAIDETVTGDDARFRVASGAIANGVATNAVSAKVTDAKGNPVAGVNVTFAVATGGDARFGSMTGNQSVVVTTDADGLASTTLVSEVAGDNQVTATVGPQTTAEKTSAFSSDFSAVTVEIKRLEGDIYSGVAIDGIHPAGTDEGTPIVGAKWGVSLSCSKAVLENDCAEERFSYQWKLSRKDSKGVKTITNVGTKSSYTVKGSDQGAELFVELTPTQPDTPEASIESAINR